MGALMVSFNQVAPADRGEPECIRLDKDNYAYLAMSYSRHYWLCRYVEHLVPDIHKRARSADRTDDDFGDELYSADYCGIAATALNEALRSGSAAAYCEAHESQKEPLSALDVYTITEFRDFLRISGGYRSS